MADISKVKLPDNVTYNLKDGSAIANITRSGTTFTATKRDGTTFTFTQQDNNTTYTIGTSGDNITLTPSSGSVQSVTAPYATDAGYLRDSVTTTAKLRYINSTDVTTWTADTLGETDSIAIMRGSVTGAPSTNHSIWLNVRSIGTRCQLWIGDVNSYIYKRHYSNSSSTWNAWTKISAGYADSAGSATKATQDGSGNTITSTYIKKAGDTMTGALTMAGTDIQLKTTGSSSDDSSDIVWYYGNGQEKCRLWTANSYTAIQGLNYRSYKSDGTLLINTQIPTFTTTPTSGQVVITDGTVGGIKSSGYTIAKSVPSNAVFTDVNVKVNNTNPTSGTWYYPVWYTATSGTGNVNANDGFRHYSLQGTASAAGRSILSLGNNTSTGTAGNKRGELFLYSEKSGRAEIVYDASATATVTHTFPATAGTILNTGTTSFTQSLSSGTKIGTIKINGTSTDLYCQTNTNNAVTQTTTTTDATYDILFSASTSGTATKTEGARKSEKLTFNPSTQTLRVGDNATGDHIINIGGSTVLNGIWGESDGTLKLYGKYYEAIHIYQTSSSGANSYIQSHHNFNMGAHTLSNGTISSMTYTEGVTNTTGYIMHGRDTTQQYSCQWASSKLNFYVGTTNIGNISDRQLKSEIEEVDPRLMEAIAECKIYQYKAFNRDGLISVGIMAQDLVEKCEKRGIRPENYELLTKMNFIQGDDTLYYSVDYNQYATFMINYLQNEIKELKAKLEK